MDTICHARTTRQAQGALARALILCRAHLGGQGRLLAAVLAGAMAGITTMSIVNMAVPGMVRHFQLGQGQAQWVASAYLLAMAAALPASPWLLQRWGLHRCYGSAVALLLSAGLLCAAADSFTTVLLGRALQGLAMGLMQPVPLLLVQRCIAASWRGRVLGALGTGVALAVAFGPMGAGLLIEHLGWRGVFALPLPLGLLSLGLLLGQRQRAAAAVAQQADSAAVTAGAAPRRPLDWPGLLLASAAMASLLQALSLAGAGAAHWAIGAMVAAVVLAAGFAIRQRQLNQAPDAGAPQPLVYAALLADRRFRLSCLAAMLYGVVLNALTYLLPLLMHDSLGMRAQQMGQLMMLAGLATVITQPLVGAQVDTRGHRPLVAVGFGVMALALALLPWAGGWGAAALTAAVALCRAGLACALAALFVPAQRALPAHLQAQGASLSQLTQTLGGALGVGLAAMGLQWRLAAHGAASAAGQAAPGQNQAMAEAFWLLAAVALLAASLSWRLRADRGG